MPLRFEEVFRGDGDSMSVKGDNRRPCSIGREEKAIRDALAYGKMTFAEYEIKYNKLLKEGKITRSGVVIKGD